MRVGENRFDWHAIGEAFIQFCCTKPDDEDFKEEFLFDFRPVLSLKYVFFLQAILRVNGRCSRDNLYLSLNKSW